MREGVYPDCFKTAKITPVFKKGSSNMISNYRPVAVLPNLSKIFESIIYDRLNDFLFKHNLLTKNQFGYRKHRNTEMAIFTLIDRVLPAFQDKKYAICVFMDFSACFDTINRSLLLDKLNRYGIRGIVFDLMKSYLTDRKQFVYFDGSSSCILSQGLGVIQGSKCGPLLYDIYSSDISKICNESEFLMYADDTCLMFTNDDIEILYREVNVNLEKFSDWCYFNKLSLNPSKCNYMLLTNKVINQDQPELFLGGEPLEKVDSVKYLGIHLDNKLKYHKHAEDLGKKLCRLRGISYKLQHHLNVGAAKNFYFSCIYSSLVYCICIWGGILQCTQRGRLLVKYHEKIVLHIFNRFVPENVCIFKHMKILKLLDLHKFSVSIYMYRMLKLNACDTLRDCLELELPQHDYSTRNRNNFVNPFPRVENIRCNYKFQCSNIWNDLPSYLKTITSFRIFKKKTMEYFLNMY